MAEKTCGAVLDSEREPGHTHRCEDAPHPAEPKHWCPGCRTWFGSTRTTTKKEA